MQWENYINQVRLWNEDNFDNDLHVPTYVLEIVNVASVASLPDMHVPNNDPLVMVLLLSLLS